MPQIKMQTEFYIPDEEFEQGIEKAIKNNPHFVLVVRCQDCLWARYDEDANAYWCNNPDLDCSCYRPGNGFCESGERREGE